MISRIMLVCPPGSIRRMGGLDKVTGLGVLFWGGFVSGGGLSFVIGFSGSGILCSTCGLIHAARVMMTMLVIRIFFH